MKIIVKLQLEPNEVKEVFDGPDLDAFRGAEDQPILIVKDTKKNLVLGEFSHWIYWVREE